MKAIQNLIIKTLNKKQNEFLEYVNNFINLQTVTSRDIEILYNYIINQTENEYPTVILCNRS